MSLPIVFHPDYQAPLRRGHPFPMSKSGYLRAALIGRGLMPATGGFLAKWFVFGVTVEAHLVAVTVAGALLSVVALGYYLRVIVVLYMQPPPAEVEPPRTARWSAGVAGAVCGAFVLAMGLFPSLFLGLLGP